MAEQLYRSALHKEICEAIYDVLGDDCSIAEADAISERIERWLEDRNGD